MKTILTLLLLVALTGCPVADDRVVEIKVVDAYQGWESRILIVEQTDTHIRHWMEGRAGKVGETFRVHARSLNDF